VREGEKKREMVWGIGGVYGQSLAKTVMREDTNLVRRVNVSETGRDFRKDLEVSRR
jgi:hypothetical protein